MTVAGIDVDKLERSDLPTDVADLGHVAGLVYELCRFTQSARSFYEKFVRVVIRNPGNLDEKLRPLRDLIAAMADGQDFEFSLEEGTKIRVEGSHFQRQRFQSPLPFLIWGPVFEQGLVTTAAFYLSLTRDTMLVRRCPECRKIFLGIRKTRIFCSHKCASAASVRAYQERQAAKKAARQKESGR